MLPELDPVVHGKLRLALLSLLAGVEEAEFTWLREKTAATDGNLGAHLGTLETAGYVKIEKDFVGKKPRTRAAITKEGRRAFAKHVAYLKDVIDTANLPEGSKP